MKIKTTILLTLILGLSAVNSSGQSNWFPEGDYRLYQHAPLGKDTFSIELFACQFEKDSLPNKHLLQNYEQFATKMDWYASIYFKDSMHQNWPVTLEVPDTGDHFFLLPYHIAIQKNFSLGDSWLGKVDNSGNNSYWIHIQVEDNYEYDATYQDSTIGLHFQVRDQLNQLVSGHQLHHKKLATVGKKLGVLEMATHQVNNGSIQQYFGGKPIYLSYSAQSGFGQRPPSAIPDIFNYQVGSEFHTSRHSSSESDTSIQSSVEQKIHKILDVQSLDSMILRVDSVYYLSYKSKEYNNGFPSEKHIDSFGYRIDTTRINLNEFRFLDTFRQNSLLYSFDSAASNRFFHLRKGNYLTSDRYELFSNSMSYSPSPNGPPFEYSGPEYRSLTKSDMFYPGFGGPYWYRGTTNPIDEPIWSEGYSLVYVKDSKGEWGHPFQRNELLSVPKKMIAEIKLYPNPASDQIHLSGLSGSFQYQVSNIRGQLVQEGKLSESKHSINTSELTNGVYFLQLRSGGQVHRAKFIVRH